MLLGRSPLQPDEVVISMDSKTPVGGPFLTRFLKYFEDVAAVLRGEAAVASIFPNASDKGTSRERIYAEFLKAHAPSKCNVFFGGFLFDFDGKESHQLDIIVTTDSTPRYDFSSKDGMGKSFAPCEGTLGVFSVKSTLDRKELFDALSNLASIPAMQTLEGRVNPQLRIPDYSEWPLKVVYASAGISPETLLSHVREFYSTNCNIPTDRRVDIIHVAGSCFISRVKKGATIKHMLTGIEEEIHEDNFRLFTTKPDVQAILWVLNILQKRASTSSHVLYTYDKMIERVLVPLEE